MRESILDSKLSQNALIYRVLITLHFLVPMRYDPSLRICNTDGFSKLCSLNFPMNVICCFLYNSLDFSKVLLPGNVFQKFQIKVRLPQNTLPQMNINATHGGMISDHFVAVVVIISCSERSQTSHA